VKLIKAKSLFSDKSIVVLPDTFPLQCNLGREGAELTSIINCMWFIKTV